MSVGTKTKCGSVKHVEKLYLSTPYLLILKLLLKSKFINSRIYNDPTRRINKYNDPDVYQLDSITEETFEDYMQYFLWK